jgi:hypothetical protein
VFEIVNNYRCKEVAQCNTLQYTHDAQVAELFEYNVIILPFNKRTPVKEETDEENQQCAFDDFFPENGIACLFQSGHYKGHGIAHSKQKKREDKIGGRITMPGSMFERGINMRPGAGVVDQDHEGDGGTTEYIEGVKALVQSNCFVESKKVSGFWLQVSGGG